MSSINADSAVSVFPRVAEARFVAAAPAAADMVFCGAVVAALNERNASASSGLLDLISVPVSACVVCMEEVTCVPACRFSSIRC